jgi:UMF1 family MFS transporter
VADRFAMKRAMLWLHAWLCATATAAMVLTGPGTVALAMVLVVVSLYAFEGGNVFYNAYLPELVEPERIPRLSGMAWACGYAGGLLTLLLALGLTQAGLGARWLPLGVAAWFVVFTLPLLLLARDAPHRGAARRGESVLGRLLAVREHPGLLRFLVALVFYMNGLETVYVFAAPFALNALGFGDVEILVLIMVMNLVAAPGALLFSRLAERRGARASIAMSLWLWLLVVAGGVAAAWPDLLGSLDTRKAVFWGVAALASLCMGATQATSRTLLAQITPGGMTSQFFGFFALAGRASGVLGPLVFGQVSALTGGDQRWAVASTGVFFAIGLVLLARVPDPRHAPVLAPVVP